MKYVFGWEESRGNEKLKAINMKVPGDKFTTFMP